MRTTLTDCSLRTQRQLMGFKLEQREATKCRVDCQHVGVVWREQINYENIMRTKGWLRDA